MLLTFNPIFYFIKAYRMILLYDVSLSLEYIITLSVIAITFLILGWNIFKKLEYKFAEEI